MKINKENYEIYFLDYFEKRLTPEQVAELMVFLEAYPDMKAEFEAFELLTIADQVDSAETSFADLKKPEYKTVGSVDAWNFEEKMVAYIEGDLSEQEQIDLRNFSTVNPKAKHELSIFHKTKLATESITYPVKSELKKGGILLLFTRPVTYTIGVAAAIIILFGVFSLLRFGENTPIQKQMANNRLPLINHKKILTNISAREGIGLRITAEEGFVLAEDEPDIVARETTRVDAIALMESHKQDLIPISSSHEMYINPVIATADIDVTNYVLPETNSESSFMGRFFAGLARKVVGDPNPDKKSLLELSVDGYNILADREVAVERQTDTDGNIIAYYVKGESVTFTRKVKKPASE